MTLRYLYNKKKNYRNNLQFNNISNFEALILGNRDITDYKLIDMFLNPTLDKLHDPFLLNDMDLAIEILIDAIDNNEKIRIFGDYDQDGISSVITLLKGISYFHSDVDYDIPDRVVDGYGLSERMVKKAHEDNVDLIITCDNGISAFDNIEMIKKLGMKVILTDHHQIHKVQKDDWINQVLPEADCVINPKRLDSTYPFDDLCGCGVAFKFMQALFDTLGGDLQYLYSLLEYVALGTICDVVDLVDENRIFVIEGLKRINAGKNKALNAILEENNWQKEVDGYTIGFIIGPCMNSTGRLSSAKIAVEMLKEESSENIKEYARNLYNLNQERKKLTEEALTISKEIIEKHYKNDDVLVIHIPHIEESICGIVAGRIKELYNRPTIILTESMNEDILKGSGRSIDNYNIFVEVNNFKELLESFGGHPLAVGLSINTKNLDQFRRSLIERSTLKDSDFEKVINIDALVDISVIDYKFIDMLNSFKPFGKKNPKITLADRDVKIVDFKLVGRNKNTLIVNFLKGGKYIKAIKFNAIEDYDYIERKIKEDKHILDIIYYPEINEFNNKKSIVLKLTDIR